MSDEMMFGIAQMPYEMAMNDELSRRQFYANTQRLVAALEAAREDALVLRLGNERLADALRELEDREQRDEALLRQDKLDAARWRYIRRKLCLTGNGDGACAMQAINLPANIQGWPEPGQVAEFCDAAIDAAIEAAMSKENSDD